MVPACDGSLVAAPRRRTLCPGWKTPSEDITVNTQHVGTVEFVVGEATDGNRPSHLMMNKWGSWSTACGVGLPEMWLPSFGATVGCGSCRRTVAYRQAP